jgi:hypothetical protein
LAIELRHPSPPAGGAKAIGSLSRATAPGTQWLKSWGRNPIALTRKIKGLSAVDNKLE